MPTAWPWLASLDFRLRGNDKKKGCGRLSIAVIRSALSLVILGGAQCYSRHPGRQPGIHDLVVASERASSCAANPDAAARGPWPPPYIPKTSSSLNLRRWLSCSWRLLLLLMIAKTIMALEAVASGKSLFTPGRSTMLFSSSRAQTRDP